MTKSPLENKKSINPAGGYALLELLFYISFFAVLSVAVIGALVTMTGAFRHTSVYTGLSRSSEIMERMAREIRSAEEISAIGAGSLKLNTRDEDDNPKTVEFRLTGSNAELWENNARTGNLNAPNIEVTTLSFTQITTVVGKAVRIEIGVRSLDDATGTTHGFYDTVALRGIY